MSTWLYLECQSHTPPLESGGEVGQHLYDLPAIRGYFTERQYLAEVDVNDLPDDTIHHYWRRVAARFFHQHPHCRVGIRDEYGEEHPVEEPEPEPTPDLQAELAASLRQLRGHPPIPVPPTIPERTRTRFTGPALRPDPSDIPPKPFTPKVTPEETP